MLMCCFDPATVEIWACSTVSPSQARTQKSNSKKCMNRKARWIENKQNKATWQVPEQETHMFLDADNGRATR